MTEYCLCISLTVTLFCLFWLSLSNFPFYFLFLSGPSRNSAVWVRLFPPWQILPRDVNKYLKFIDKNSSIWYKSLWGFVPYPKTCVHLFCLSVSRICRLDYSYRVALVARLTRVLEVPAPVAAVKVVVGHSFSDFFFEQSPQIPMTSHLEKNNVFLEVEVIVHTFVNQCHFWSFKFKTDIYKINTFNPNGNNRLRVKWNPFPHSNLYTKQMKYYNFISTFQHTHIDYG